MRSLPKLATKNERSPVSPPPTKTPGGLTSERIATSPLLVILISRRPEQTEKPPSVLKRLRMI